jgi:metallophosphoesterase (TIGR03767 family)
VTTFRRALVGGPPGAGGYRRLVPGPGSVHVVREDLAPVADATEPLLALSHVSDLHLCDAQSPARAEMLDRWSDPDSPIRDVVGDIGTYRAQEMLTAQVAAAWVQAANSSTEGPVTGRPIDLAVVTGDNTDNGQANELDWYLTLLDGGTVAADSGDPQRWEGVGARDCHDERYWHPDGLIPDVALSEFGFPVVRGLLDAARAPVVSAGLDVPWLAVHGNHDNLLQGTVPGRGRLRRWPVGARKPVALPPDLSVSEIAQLLDGLASCSPASLEVLGRATTRPVAPDPARRLTSLEEFVAAHDTTRARPPRHGFRVDGRSYYSHDVGPVRFVVLDTVNPYGGWQGSLDAGQLLWLDGVLTQADAEERYVVLASHHPLGTLVNDIALPDARPRVLGSAVSALLSRHPCVVLWLNGHTHRTSVEPHGSWWEVTAPSLIDWPQQGRVVEIMRGPETLTIAVTMLDHAGEAPWSGGLDSVVALAGLSRELAANDWQTRVADLDAHPRAGVPEERNTLLVLPDPWADAGQPRSRLAEARKRRPSVEV